MNNTETNYSTTEKEALAIIWAIEKYKPYLYGNKFLLITDHKPLTFIKSSFKNSKILRWRLELGNLDYEVKNREGKTNVVAAVLSRKPQGIDDNHNAIDINSSPVSDNQEQDRDTEANSEEQSDSEHNRTFSTHEENETPPTDEDNQEQDSESRNGSEGRIDGENNRTSSANEGNETPLMDEGNDLDTIHSAEESADNFIHFTEKPINSFKNQLIFRVANFTSEINENPFPHFKKNTIVQPQTYLVTKKFPEFLI